MITLLIYNAKSFEQLEILFLCMYNLMSLLQKDIAVMMNRTFHYVGEFVPVKWKCRGKLPNGKLCERMDREKVELSFSFVKFCD